MTDIARLGIRVESQEAEVADQRLDELAASAAKAEVHVDGLAAAARGTSGPLATMNTAIAQQSRALAMSQRSMGLTTQEGLNMGRQMSDIGVQLAMGMNPFMIAIQQGPQIFDVFQMAAIRAGTTVRAAMVETGIAVWTALAPLLPIIAGIAAGAALVAAAWGLTTRAMSKGAGDLTKDMGLTKDQMKQLEKQGVSTSITAGDAFRGLGTTIKEMLVEVFGDQLDAVGKWWNSFLDGATKVAVFAVKTIGGSFLGAFYTIRDTWKMLPAAIGDAAIQAVNLALKPLDFLINRAIDGINLIRRANGAQPLQNLDLSFNNPLAGSSRALAVQGGASMQQGMQDYSAGLDRFMARWRENAAASGRARIRAAAGEPDTSGHSTASKASKDLGADNDNEEQATIDNAALSNRLVLLNKEIDLIGQTDRATAVAMAREAKRIELAEQGFTVSDEGYQRAIDLAGEVAARQVDLAQGQAAYNDQLRQTLDHARQLDEHARDMARGLASAFGEPGRAMGDLITQMTGYQARIEEIAARERDMRNAGTLTTERMAELERDRAHAQIQNYGDMAAAARGFFNEGSTGYRLMLALEQVYRAQQLVGMLHAMATGKQETVSAIAGSLARGAANIAEGASKMFAALGPYAFPAVAAMLAVLAGLGLRHGGGGGGGGGTSSSAPGEGATSSVRAAGVQQKAVRGQPPASQTVNVVVAPNDDRFNAYVDGRTDPKIRAASTAAEHTARQIVWDEGPVAVATAQMQGRAGA